MTCTARQLNRATLERQLLLAREPVDVLTAIDRIVAIQAQEDAGAAGPGPRRRLLRRSRSDSPGRVPQSS